MSRFPEIIAVLALALALTPAAARAEGDVGKGEKLFKRCAACHAVGEGAKNKLGPHLNELFGRTAGEIEGFKYSKAMKESAIVWSDETLDAFLEKPRSYVKGTRMSFPGLKKGDDRADMIAYLRSLGTAVEQASKPAEAVPATAQPAKAAAATSRPLAAAVDLPAHGVFHLGRAATDDEVVAWDIDVRPDGAGLPVGKGTVAEGDPIFAERCASCHGDFGEGRDRWPVLAGGFDTLTAERPEKTIGSYWPFLSTVYDYVRRAMPFGDARSMTDDEVYAVTAYLLYLNDIVTDEDFELSNETFSSVELPNEANFIADNRASEPHYADKSEPCMKDCKPEPAKVVMRARVLDVTPDNDASEGVGAVD